MQVTNHATQRFLERVLNSKEYTYRDFNLVKRKLIKLFENVTPGSYSRPFVLPGFSKFRVIHRDNVVITIIPKSSSL